MKQSTNNSNFIMKNNKDIYIEIVCIKLHVIINKLYSLSQYKYKFLGELIYNENRLYSDFFRIKFSLMNFLNTKDLLP